MSMRMQLPGRCQYLSFLKIDLARVISYDLRDNAGLAYRKEHLTRALVNPAAAYIEFQMVPTRPVVIDSAAGRN